MQARRIGPSTLAALSPDELTGAVLLAPVRLPHETLRKGTRLGHEEAARLVAAASEGRLPEPLRLAYPDPGDLHEDEAAERLARAVAGPGISPRTPRQSRLDLAARWDGVLHVRAAQLTALNILDPLEVFTLYHGQAVAAGQTVASVKVAPHLVPEAVVAEGERLALPGPVVDVRPYLALEVGAIAEEALDDEALARFEASARRKVEALGSRFTGTLVVRDAEPELAERKLRAALVDAVRTRRLPVVLVGGVSAGDPLSPFYAALESLGGRLLRRGVPAHPGSMIWLAELDGSRLLGLPQCGMFSMATAADLVLPRLLTGEALTAADLAELAHGGVLGKEMRFRFPAYARELRAPEG
jgi:hypothetical protein